MAPSEASSALLGAAPTGTTRGTASLQFCGVNLAPLFFALVALNFVEVATTTPVLVFILRPLPALVLATGTFERSWLVWVGLLWGSVGDLVLSLGAFVPGLIAFLFGHVFYITAYTLESRRLGLAAGIPAAGYTATLLGIVAPSSGALVGPIAVYGAILCSMAWRASVAATIDAASVPAHLRAAGAWLFVLSDSLIAVSRFVAPFAGSGTAIFVTYYAAQFLLALTAPEGPLEEVPLEGGGGVPSAAVRCLSGGCALHRSTRRR